jgi:putative hydrolase of the HAD superfamily
MGKPSFVYFDAVGTLLQLRESVGTTYARFARPHGLTADPGRLQQAFRTSFRQLLHGLQRDGTPSPDDDRSWWREVVHSCFTASMDQEPPREVIDRFFPDLYRHFGTGGAWFVPTETKAALEALHRNVPLGVLSNFDGRLEPVLSDTGIRPLFGPVILSSRIGYAKPHPAIFAAAAGAAGLPAERILHVGDDHDADVRGAMEAGLEVHAVGPGGFGWKDYERIQELFS